MDASIVILKSWWLYQRKNYHLMGDFELYHHRHHRHLYNYSHQHYRKNSNNNDYNIDRSMNRTEADLSYITSRLIGKLKEKQQMTHLN